MPKTTWIGDSFTQRVLGGRDGADGKLQPFFADLTRVPELTKAVLAQNPKTAPDLYTRARAAMIQSIVDSKVTVLELVERTFAGASGYGSMWAPSSAGYTGFLDQLQKALDAAPKK